MCFLTTLLKSIIQHTHTLQQILLLAICKKNWRPNLTSSRFKNIVVVSTKLIFKTKYFNGVFLSSTDNYTWPFWENTSRPFGLSFGWLHTPPVWTYETMTYKHHYIWPYLQDNRTLFDGCWLQALRLVYILSNKFLYFASTGLYTYAIKMKPWHACIKRNQTVLYTWTLIYIGGHHIITKHQQNDIIDVVDCVCVCVCAKLQTKKLLHI